VIAEAERYTVALDGRAVRTPAKLALSMPSETLAEAVAAEWDAQAETVNPLEMPITRLVSTAIDRVPTHRVLLVDELVGYGDSDLLCYRAEHPPELAARQEAVWQPLLDWAGQRYGARLEATQGLMHHAQPAASLAALRAAIEALDDLALAALHSATAAAGSLVIGLALLEGRLGAHEAFEASQTDESFQIERWGEDEEAMRRRAGIRDELFMIERVSALRRDES